MNKVANKIYMQEWLNLHSYQKATANDQWYLDLAHRLLLEIGESLYLEYLNTDLRKRLALALTIYFEDTVSEGGGWSRFKAEFKKLYDKELPFYAIEADNYFHDDINKEDIQFIVWSVMTLEEDEEGNVSFVDPLGYDLLKNAENIFNILADCFEDAPITDALSVDWVMDMEQMRRKKRDLPSTDVADCKSESAKNFLKHTEGNPIQFFATYEDLKKFFVDVLKWEDKPEDLMPEMAAYSNFILFANAKGLLMAPEAATYFEAPHNELFDKEQAEQEGYILFCEQGACPYDLLKYGMENGMLDHIRLPLPEGRELFVENSDFIARWYLGEYYEGD